VQLLRGQITEEIYRAASQAPAHFLLDEQVFDGGGNG